MLPDKILLDKPVLDNLIAQLHHRPRRLLRQINRYVGHMLLTSSYYVKILAAECFPRLLKKQLPSLEDSPRFFHERLYPLNAFLIGKDAQAQKITFLKYRYHSQSPLVANPEDKKALWSLIGIHKKTDTYLTEPQRIQKAVRNAANHACVNFLADLTHFEGAESELFLKAAKKGREDIVTLLLQKQNQPGIRLRLSKPTKTLGLFHTLLHSHLSLFNKATGHCINTKQLVQLKTKSRNESQPLCVYAIGFGQQSISQAAFAQEAAKVFRGLACALVYALKTQCLFYLNTFIRHFNCNHLTPLQKQSYFYFAFYQAAKNPKKAIFKWILKHIFVTEKDKTALFLKALTLRHLPLLRACLHYELAPTGPSFLEEAINALCDVKKHHYLHTAIEWGDKVVVEIILSTPYWKRLSTDSQYKALRKTLINRNSALFELVLSTLPDDLPFYKVFAENMAEHIAQQGDPFFADMALVFQAKTQQCHKPTYNAYWHLGHATKIKETIMVQNTVARIQASIANQMPGACALLEQLFADRSDTQLARIFHYLAQICPFSFHRFFTNVQRQINYSPTKNLWAVFKQENRQTDQLIILATLRQSMRPAAPTASLRQHILHRHF